MQALARASAHNSREYFCNRCCQFQVLRDYSLGYWRYLSVPVIGNVMASLISSTVIKFLAVIANGGGFVIPPFLLILEVIKRGWFGVVSAYKRI
jgi:hypothetical protein